MPPLKMIEQSLNMHPAILPAERGLRAKYDLSGVEALRENEKELTASAKTGLESGLTVNEARQRFWNLGPIEGGEICPAVERAAQPAFNVAPEATAPAASATPDVTAPDPSAGLPVEQSQTEAAIVNQVALNGAQVTSMLEVVNRVALGELPRDSGIAMLVGAFGLTQASADSIMGEVGRSFHITPPVDENVPRGTIDPAAAPKDAKEVPIQPDAAAIGSDVTPTTITYEQRVAELTAIYIGQGIPAANASLRAQEQAALEGFKPAAPAAPAPAAPAEPSKVADPSSAVAVAPNAIKIPFSDEQIAAHWKTMSESGIEQLFAQRKDEVKEFFSKLSKLYLKRFEKNLKKHGIGMIGKIKAGDEDVVDEEALDALLAAEADLLASGSMRASSEYGFNQQLLDFKMNYPAERASEQLKETAARNIQHVSNTTKADVREILGKATEEATSLTEVSNQLREYFGESQTEGRVNTIVRTEVLGAVSAGQSLKTEEFKNEFPKEAKRLKKIWINSRDEKVRGNPDGLYPAKSPDDADHWTLDKETRGIDEAFSNGLQYPREDGGEAKQIINCRCAWLTYLAEDEDMITDIVEEGAPGADAEVKAIELPPRRWRKAGVQK